jgi:hypothetical protein
MGRVSFQIPTGPTSEAKTTTTTLVRLSDFTCIQEPHPYGVLPGGNRFLFQERNQQPSTNGNNQERRRLPFDDGLWQQILSFCDGSTLGNIVQTSRYLYVAGHQSELWRNLVLRKTTEKKSIISIVGPSWKDTYVVLFHNKNNNKDLSSSTNKLHTPIKMKEIYSDDIYQSHLCRSFTIPSSWLLGSDMTTTSQHQDHNNNNNNNNKTIVPRVSADDLTPEEFFTKYEEQNQPVVIQGAGNSRAVHKWNDWDYLKKHSKCSKSFRTTSGAAPLPGNFQLSAYEGYTKFDYLEESPLYLFDRNAFVDNTQWKNDFFPQFYQRCPYWDPSGPYGHDLLQHLGEVERPDHTWLIMGPKRSGSVFHIDPNATHAWNACIQGRKRWIFYPPGQPPPGVLPSPDGDEVALPLSVGEWIMQYWTEHVQQYRKRPVGQRPLECTTYPGDVIFVPHGWWHSVINLDDMNIAITHNYVSPSNLGNALKFFTEKHDQISGCRDRAESIKPEHIHDELVRVLGEKEPHHLKRALEQKCWTCRAWEDNRSRMSHEIEVPNNSNDQQNFSNSKKKQRTSDTCEDGGKSIMSKTERVESFSFSFL